MLQVLRLVSWLRASALLRYGAVTLLVGATTLALQLANPSLEPSIVALLYLLPVLLSALLAGWLGGMLASLLSFLAFNYFFLPPYRTFVVANPGDTLALFVFLAVAGLVSYLLGVARAEAQRARQRERDAMQRQHELTILYELSKAIGRQIGLEPTLQTIAGRVSQLFAGRRCEIWLKPEDGSLALAVQAGPAAGDGPGAPKPFEVLIRSDKDALGILKVFGAGVQPEEAQLLNAIAAQAALAIERSRLMQAATRARVLDESDRLKSALLLSVSHDMRTPLATIKAAITGLLRRDLNWDAESTLDQFQAIDEETDRLNRIIGNLLSMSRIEAGAVQLDKTPYPLGEVMDSVLSRLAPRLPAQRVVVTIPPDLPPVPLDYAAFEQIMTNLLDNAVKYSPPNSPITISARQVGRLVEIGVTDCGRGIAPEAQAAVFEKFYRADGSARVPGSGLGLSIVKGLVEAHGGRAWISSQVGHGTTVRFVLPLQAPTGS